MIGARATFCAAHKLPQHSELHGHSYEVWAYTDNWDDVEGWQKHLRAVVVQLDHKTLASELSTMEAIAEWVAANTAAARVKVIRPVEGLSAEWQA